MSLENWLKNGWLTEHRAVAKNSVQLEKRVGDARKPADGPPPRHSGQSRIGVRGRSRNPESGPRIVVRGDGRIPTNRIKILAFAISPQNRKFEISSRVVDRDLQDSQVAALSPEWRLNIAYNAALQAATAALAACGYRAAREAHHFRIIQSLAHTIGAEKSLIHQFEGFRKKRNIGGYERMGLVSDHEAEEILALAMDLRNKVTDWLHSNFPRFL